LRHDVGRALRRARRAPDPGRRARPGRAGIPQAGAETGGHVTEALIFLAAAVVGVPIASRLGLGSVLGYLIAGALIGPWGLGFVKEVEATQNLAELGVVLMLFVIGLELDLRRLSTMRRNVFVGGGI